MYNIFYIYTYKYTKPSNTLMLSRPKRPQKPILHKQPDKPNQQAQAARHLYRAKCTSRIMPPSHIAGLSAHMWRF